MLQLLIILILIVVVVYLIIKNIEWKLKFEQKVKDYLMKNEMKIKKEAIEKSSRILSGKTLEKLIPFLKKFSHDPHDVRWLGDPIDLVVFDGSSSGKPEKITFIEVKSGSSKLSKKQKKIREIVKNKKIFWEEFKT